ncbi:MAG: nuclease-related domain-containing protein [Desulfobacula sp.]|jgi:hypothetical protein|nr:nuclease-related domain-containing protein [Desulfobacula sp.]
MLFHNFEICKGIEVFEIDLAIISPHAVYLVDVKGTHGLINEENKLENIPPFSLYFEMETCKIG